MSIAVVAAVVVGAAFLLAGGAKMAAGPSWPAQARALGAPAPVIPVVPWVEVVVGALLCTQIARPVVASVAALMLISFTVLLLARLAKGQRPPCACFGSWSARPLSWKHVARNVVLLALAVVAAVG